MAVFRIERPTHLAAPEAWRRLTTWERHTGSVPLTTIRVTTPPPNRVGTTFAARTGIGRAAFDDPMEVVRWSPPAAGRPGHCRLVKRGSVVLGWAEIEVHPLPHGSRIVWREELRLRRLPRLLDAATAHAARPLFAHALTRLLRD
ncbi:SRPBCC family protein [Allostreptomyces psammosilenae]|uniref:Immediate-early protein 2 n=1 Tax=Allostreptomyces psammosilenae TaxID=1892865 RepID=A0A852ZRJ6_9ACTN|nr:SRPBCC family protein [Allostreptomyces psammosilenae]NYI03484.1 hypothetical protein [Allostreptomyces psammosilenae]